MENVKLIPNNVGVQVLVEAVSMLNELECLKKKISITKNGSTHEKLAYAFVKAVDSIEMDDDELLNLLPKPVIKTYELLFPDEEVQVDQPSSPSEGEGSLSENKEETSPVSKEETQPKTKKEGARPTRTKVTDFESLKQKILKKSDSSVTAMLDKMVVEGATKQELYEAAKNASSGKAWQTERDIDSYIKYREDNMGMVFEKSDVIKLVGFNG